MGRLLTIGIICYLISIPCLAEDGDADADTPAKSRILVFKGYHQATPFKIAKERRRKPKCIRCHDQMDPNFTPRNLEDAPHTDELSHGIGKLWCLTCHDAENRNMLRTMVGEKVGFDQSYIVCGACHSYRQRDWYFGGHGKRESSWQDDRVIYNCTHCHDPHEPAIEAREPQPPPPVRAGLQRPKQNTHKQKHSWRIHLGDAVD